MKKYNLAIIPPEETAQKAIAISRRIAAVRAAHFTLDDVAFHPHISLYHVALDPARLEQAIESVATALQIWQPFMLKQGPYRAVHDEWIDVSYNKEAALLGLHTTVVEAAKDFRLDIGQEGSDSSEKELSGIQQQNLIDCGWTRAFDLYAPHLTLARLKEKDPNILAALPTEDLAFRVERIGLYEMGEHGTCTRLLYEFALKK